MCSTDLVNKISDELKKILLAQNYTIDEIKMLTGYIKGNTALEDIINKFTDLYPKEKDYVRGREVSYAWKKIFDSFKAALKNNGTNESYERFFISLGLMKYCYAAFQIIERHKYFSLLIKYKLPVSIIIANLCGEGVNGYYFSVKGTLEYCVKEDILETHKIIKELEREPENNVYQIIINYAEILTTMKDKNSAGLLFDMLDCKYSAYSNAVKEIVLRDTSYGEYADILIEDYYAKNLKLRERISCFLIDLYLCQKKDDVKDKLKKICLDILKNEKSKKIKYEITTRLKLEDNNNKDEECAKIQAILHDNKRVTFKWMDLKNLSEVRFKDKEEAASEDYLKSLICCYGIENSIYISDEGELLAAKLNKKDLSIFASQVFDKWIEDGAAAKKKYALNFAANFGDDDFIHKVEKHITYWAANSRTALAKEAINALAVSRADQALILLDKISNKFKSKAVKNSAKEALAKLAGNLKISPDELSDRLIPDFGFDKNGEKLFDYGERKIKVILNADLSLEVYDDKGKKSKTLPKAVKGDDEAKVKAVGEEFKILKKSLKTAYDIQKKRLKISLINGRKWTRDLWSSIFVNNPMMSRLADSIVWGVYENDKLIDTFRCGEDGTFNTIDEEEFVFEDKEILKIGIVYPTELTEEERNKWIEQFENYEIVQPINQLYRKIFTVNEVEMKSRSVERFGGRIVNGIKALKILEAYGWERGPILEGSLYLYFYKEIKEKRIRIELSFDELISGSESSIDATIFKLKFYKMNNKEKNNYRYESIKDAEYLILPQNVPERIFTETLYEVDKMLNSSTGYDKDWKRRAD